MLLFPTMLCYNKAYINGIKCESIQLRPGFKGVLSIKEIKPGPKSFSVLDET